MDWNDAITQGHHMDYILSSAPTPRIPFPEIECADGTLLLDSRRSNPAMMDRFMGTQPSEDPYALVPAGNGDFIYGSGSHSGQSAHSPGLGLQPFAYDYRHTSPVDTDYSSASMSALSSTGSIDPRYCGFGDALSPSFPTQASFNEVSWSLNPFDAPASPELEWNANILEKLNDDQRFGIAQPALSPHVTCFEPIVKAEEFQIQLDEYESGDGSVTSSTSDDVFTKSDAEDSEYTPNQRRTKVKSLSRLPKSSITAFKIHKISKHPANKVGKEKSARAASASSSETHHSCMDIEGSSSPFTCPLTPYGCKSYFTSKNEWKRHIQSHHLAIGFWSCDLCPDDVGPKAFNRKDLFNAHLTRMHFKQKVEQDTLDNTIPPSKRGSRAQNKSKAKTKAKSRSKSQGSSGKNEEKDEVLLKQLQAARDRCWVRVRDPPNELECVVCRKRFSGINSCDAWLEHVGKHLANRSLNESSVDYDNTQPADWAADKLFAKWLVEHHLLEADPSQPGRNQWILVSREQADKKSLNGDFARCDILDDDIDAEGELDD